MGLLTALNQSLKRKNARNIIEAALGDQQALGFFSEDVTEAARQVVTFPGLHQEAYNFSYPVLAGFMLARYISGSSMSHENLLPYGSACSAILSVASDPRKFSMIRREADQFGMQLCLTALEKFYDESPIKLTLEVEDSSNAGPSSNGSCEKNAIPITGADSSVLCILREYELLNEMYGGDGTWEMCGQTTLEKDGRSYDVLEISVLNQGPKALWFDITDSKLLWKGHSDIAATARLDATLDAAKKR
jgi:hypothetical protein